MQETQILSLGLEDPMEKEMAIYSNVLSGKSHGRRILAGYNPRGNKSQTWLSDWVNTHAHTEDNSPETATQ